MPEYSSERRDNHRPPEQQEQQRLGGVLAWQDGASREHGHRDQQHGRKRDVAPAALDVQRRSRLAAAQKQVDGVLPPAVVEVILVITYQRVDAVAN